MTDDKRERVAKAIYNVAPMVSEGAVIPWDDLVFHHCQRFYELADAALAAMGEGTGPDVGDVRWAAVADALEMLSGALMGNFGLIGIPADQAAAHLEAFQANIATIREKGSADHD